jgi:glycerol kinase
MATAAVSLQVRAMPRYVLALDQGTTSSRAIVFDRQGRPRGSAQQEFTQHFPGPGFVEHSPRDLWETTRLTALGALAKANVSARAIRRCCGIAGRASRCTARSYGRIGERRDCAKS